MAPADTDQIMVIMYICTIYKKKQIKTLVSVYVWRNCEVPYYYTTGYLLRTRHSFPSDPENDER